MIHKQVLLFLILITGIQFSFAQTKEQIRAQQQALQRELSELNTNLKEVKKTQKISFGQLKLIEDKISTRQQLINNISTDIKSLDGQIAEYNLQLEKHKKELDTLKANYAKSLVDAYKKRNNYDYINFIFSSKSFNDAYKRLQYLKSYRSYRDAQVSDIKNTQSLIQGKINEISKLKGNKNTALISQNDQLKGLEADKIEKDEAIKELQGREGELADEIKSREKQRDQLRRVLNDVIRREILEAQRQERERLARIAAARIAEEERNARIEAQRKADAAAEKEKIAAYEKVKREREEAAAKAAAAERERKLTEERMAKEKQEREERMAREKKEMEDRLAREKADAARKAERDRQLKRMEDRNRAIDEANARDLAKKKAEEDKAKQEVARLDKQNATVAPPAVATEEEKAEVKRRVEQEVAQESRNEAANKGRSYNVLEASRETMTQSLDFEKNRGALPWPASGYVSQPYGNYTLPGSKIREYNPGIEITSNGDAGVRSVANGAVSVVVRMDDGFTVIVRHGKYFTTYNHLASVNVSKGQNVQAGTVIGSMGAGIYGKPTMLFIVSDDKGNEMNPTGWLR